MSTTDQARVPTLVDRPIRPLSELRAAVRSAGEREVWMPTSTDAERRARAAACDEQAELWDDVWHAVKGDDSDSAALLGYAALVAAGTARENGRFWRLLSTTSTTP